jgi:hypothetical protein
MVSKLYKFFTPTSVLIPVEAYLFD